MMKFIADPPHVSQAPLLDHLLERLECKNDAALSRKVKLAPPIVSKLRNGRLQVSAHTLLHLHDQTGISIPELRALVTPDPQPEA